MRPAFLLLFLLALSLAAQAPPSSPPPAQHMPRLSDGEMMLRQMEAKLAAAVAAKDRKAFLALWAEDAAIFPPGSPVVVGREGILAEWDPILSKPDVSLTWSPDRVELSSSGDLGYTYGKYRWNGKGPDVDPMVRNGKYVSIWRKEKDGQWRVVVDLGTPSDPPSMPAAKPQPKPTP